MIEVVPAKLTHVGPIATRMRAIDALECAVSGITPKQALRHGLEYSLQAWTVMVDGRPEAMLGIVSTSFLDGAGQIWLLLTDDGAKQHKALVRLGKRYVAAAARHFPILHNRVHADNIRAIRWLSYLGFVIGPVDVINGQPMRPFSLCVTP